MTVELARVAQHAHAYYTGYIISFKFKESRYHKHNKFVFKCLNNAS